MKKKTILIVSFIFFSLNIFSQDIIIKKNNDSIFCNVIKIGTKIIEYDSTKYSNNTVFEIKRDDVFKIMFENKEEKNLKNDSLSYNVYADNKKNAIKFYMLSMFAGHFGIGYERSITAGSSLEFGTSYIFGVQKNRTYEIGGTARIGYKFIKLRDYSPQDVRYMHLMKGSYIKPELIFSAFNSSYDFINEYGLKQTHSEDLFSFSFMLNFGVQYIYDNTFLLDFYAGAGGSIASENEDYFYSNAAITDKHSDFGLSLTIGVKIGGLF